MIKYVETFVFNHDQTRVALVLKNRGPPYVVGRWNGIGGKLELAETIRQATSREFREEAGLDIDVKRWRFFLELYDDEWVVFFATVTLGKHESHDIKTMEDEKIAWHDVYDLPTGLVPNLEWAIPLALDSTIVNANIEMR